MKNRLMMDKLYNEFLEQAHTTTRRNDLIRLFFKYHHQIAIYNIKHESARYKAQNKGKIVKDTWKRQHDEIDQYCIEYSLKHVYPFFEAINKPLRLKPNTVLLIK